MPPGTNPPFIITYNASSVPILRLGLSGKGLSEQQLFDLGVNFIRTQLATVQGASIPLPLSRREAAPDSGGSRSRRASVKGLSPNDVVNAISVQNLILPGGTSKIGDIEYDVRMNGGPTRSKSSTIFQSGPSAPRQSTFGTSRTCATATRDDEHRSCRRPARRHVDRIEVRKRVDPRHHSTRQGNAAPRSRLGCLPNCRSTTRRPVGVRQRSDSGRCPRSCHRRVLDRGHDPRVPRQFAQHGDHRRVDASVDPDMPIIVLSSLGETINIMTLGGLALAVGILVDDVTGGDREHQFASGAWQGAGAGDSGWCGPDCRAGLRFHAVHLLVFVPMFFLSKSNHKMNRGLQALDEDEFMTGEFPSLRYLT